MSDNAHCGVCGAAFSSVADAKRCTHGSPTPEPMTREELDVLQARIKEVGHSVYVSPETFAPLFDAARAGLEDREWLTGDDADLCRQAADHFDAEARPLGMSANPFTRHLRDLAARIDAARNKSTERSGRSPSSGESDG